MLYLLILQHCLPLQVSLQTMSESASDEPTCTWCSQRQITQPPGWSTDTQDLDYDHEWATDDSEGQEICAYFELGRAHPIIRHVLRIS